MSNDAIKKELVQRPNWLRVKAPTSPEYHSIKEMMREEKLSTVCESAHCPNIGECWSQRTATFMLMGNVCTRACKFCAVKTGNPQGVLDVFEPTKVGKSVARLKLKYVVLTSVDRDDLPDFGADHFSQTVEVIRQNDLDVIVEVLTPDFQGNEACLNRIIKSSPHVFAHNIETVERLTPKVRDRRSTYKNSMKVLAYIKQNAPHLFTKTSIMLGHSETEAEVIQTLKELRDIGCDVVTFGQYLRPTLRHLPVVEYIHPDQFKYWQEVAEKMGFLYVASGPLVRSSYKAAEYFIQGIIEKGYNAQNALESKIHHQKNVKVQAC